MLNHEPGAWRAASVPKAKMAAASGAAFRSIPGTSSGAGRCNQEAGEFIARATGRRLIRLLSRLKYSSDVEVKSGLMIVVSSSRQIDRKNRGIGPKK